MKKQDEKFIEVRTPVRESVVMKRLGLKAQTYHKLMGQKVNGQVNRDLEEWEVEDIIDSLESLVETIDIFLDELYN